MLRPIGAKHYWKETQTKFRRSAGIVYVYIFLVFQTFYNTHSTRIFLGESQILNGIYLRLDAHTLHGQVLGIFIIKDFFVIFCNKTNMNFKKTMRSKQRIPSNSILHYVNKNENTVVSEILRIENNNKTEEKEKQ